MGVGAYALNHLSNPSAECEAEKTATQPNADVAFEKCDCGKEHACGFKNMKKNKIDGRGDII